MRLLTRLPLSITIPAILLAFTALISIFLFVDITYRSTLKIERDEIRELREDMTSLQSYISDSLIAGDRQKAAKALSLFSPHPYLSALIVADENDVVIISNRNEWLGKKANDVFSDYDPNMAASLKKSMKVDIRLTDDKKDILGYFPVVMELKKGELRPSRIGILYLDEDLRDLLAEARHDAAIEAVLILLQFTVFIIGLGVLLHYLITMRLKRLWYQAENIKMGDLSTKSNISGGDEIAALAASLDVMTNSLVDQQIKLLAEMSAKESKEEELRRSEELYRGLVDNAGIGIALINRDMEILSVNSLMKKWFPCTLDIDLPKRLICYKGLLCPAGDDICHDCPTQRTFSDGDVHESLFKAESSGKDARSYRIITSPLTDKEGNIVAAIAMFDDITDRLKAEEDLKILLKAIEHSADTVVITDLVGTIKYVNPKFVKTTGYSKEEAIGRNPRILKSGATQPDEYRKMWEVISSGNEWHGLFHNKRKDGSLYWESAAISPVKNENGEITHYVAIKQDITERMKAEEDMKKKENLLLLGQVVGSIAHDLRNPLNTIQLAAEVLGLHITNPSQVQKDCMESIKSETTRCEGIISGLLDSLRSKKTQLTLTSVEEVIEISVMKCHIPGNVTLTLNISSSLPALLADPLQMIQILVNLITNAVQAMPDGGTLTISAAVGKEMNAVIITVADTGMGIPKENFKKLFSPLFTTKKEGTGLGLVIVKDLTEANGGRVRVESEPGKGTVFSLTFPLRDNQFEKGMNLNPTA